MAIQNELPYGGTGWHGDQAVSLRSTLGGLNALVLDIRTQYKALLLAIDTHDAGSSALVGSAVDVVAAAPAVPTAMVPPVAQATLEHIANGGSYAHGDNAVKLREYLDDHRDVVNEVQADLAALLAFLDADTPGTIDDGDYVASIPMTASAAGIIHSRFANGGEAAHGDQGVQMRLGLVGMATLANELKADFNALLGKIEADSAAAFDYNSLAVTAASV